MYIRGHYAFALFFVLLGESGILFVYTLIGLIKSNPLPYMIPPQFLPPPSGQQCQCTGQYPDPNNSPAILTGPGLPAPPVQDQPLPYVSYIVLTVTARDGPLPTMSLASSTTSSEGSKTTNPPTSTDGKDQSTLSTKVVTAVPHTTTTVFITKSVT